MAPRIVLFADVIAGAGVTTPEWPVSHVLSQQTQDIDPMFRCWINVGPAGPTFIQHLMIARCDE